jgi:hypothetical protein
LFFGQLLLSQPNSALLLLFHIVIIGFGLICQESNVVGLSEFLALAALGWDFTGSVSFAVLVQRFHLFRFRFVE